MRYHGDHHVLPLFGPWRWAPYMRGNFHWKKYQNARSFFLSHTSKLNQQKQWEAVSKSTAKIYPSNKYNIFPSFIIDQSWNTLQLKNIVLSFHPPFEPISALFTFTGLWPFETILSVCPSVRPPVRLLFCASREGSGESAHLYRLAWASSLYQNPMCWRVCSIAQARLSLVTVTKSHVLVQMVIYVPFM